MNIIQYPTNVYTVGHYKPIKFGVIHFTSARYWPGFEKDKYNVQANLDIFAKQGKIDKFSAHFLIGRKGETYQMVDIKDTAYHAGKSIVAMPGLYENINDISIGIELLGDLGEPYTTEQYQTVAELANKIENDVMALNLGYIEHWLGHDWIAGEIAVRLGIRNQQTMKRDPGLSFDWDIFLREKYRIRLYNELRSTFKAELKNEILSELTTGEILKLLVKKPK